MKLLLPFLLFFFSSSLLAQNFEDDFSDNDFSSNPSWTGADSNFVVFELDGNNVLRLNDNEAATSYLSTPSVNVIGEWEFFVRIDGSTPSNGNKAEIFLMSDIADLSGTVNGYAVRIGQTGDDFFKIVRLDGGVQTTVLEDTTRFEGGGSYRVKVTRDGSGTWSLEVGEGYNGELKNAGPTAIDNTYSEASFFGVSVTYTSTRIDDFYFDFKIDPPPVIIEPLLVDNFLVFSDTEIDFSFTRDIDFSSVAVSDFTLNGDTNPQTFSNQGSDALRITFTGAFNGGENELLVSGIESSVNDTVLADTTFTFFVFDDFETGDIIINEFLKDPPPGSGIPEYVELKNTTSKHLNLKDWEIGDNGSLASISDEDLVLLPDSFLVVTSNPEGIIAAFGEGVYVDVSLPAFNNTTDQIRVYDENDNTIDSLEYTPAWGGEDVALERRSKDLGSTFQANWGDSPNALGGTPGRKNEVEIDTIPPAIQSFEFLNDSTIQLVFTEEIKQKPAENPDNYNILVPLKINPIVAVGENDFVKASFFAPDTVLLEFKQPIYTTQFQNILSIENQEDVFGNLAETLQIQYELRQTQDAEPGDIVINEFMYDPAEGYSEFVEINSHTSKVINLKGWTLSDNTGNEQVLTVEDFFITSNTTAVQFGYAFNQFTILVPDATISELPERRIDMGARFPALNNTTDAIVLKNADGITIDSLTYFRSWGGDEISLERRTINILGIYRANWGDSPSPDFATPGKVNAIEPDTEAPFLESAFLRDNETIILNFNETLVQEPALEPGNYSILPAKSIESLSLSADTVQLEISPALTDGESIKIDIQFQEDIFGNVRDTSGTVTLTYFEITPATKNEVVINEILYRRKDELSPEFVELFNISEKNFDLSGWTLKDASSSRSIIPEGTFLPAGAYLVLTDREDFAASLDNGIFLPGFPSLNDNGDAVIVKNKDEITIDSLFYQSTWGGDSPGVSLERKDPEAASSDESNWGTSTAEGGFSAGVVSSIFEEDTSPPAIIFAAENDTATFVAFSEFIQVTTQTQFKINNEEVEILNFDPDQANQIYIGKGQEIESVPKTNSKAVLNIEILNLTDIKGNVATSATSSVSLPLVIGDIVINEIMFDPLANSEDNLPDQTEYIELYNRSNRAISLEGISLHDAPDEDNEIRSLFPITSQYKWIEPQGYFLVYAEDETDNFSESRIARYFSMEGESDQFTMQVDRSSLSLASTGDAIYLADSAGTTIDSVFYNEDWQNPNVFDTDGIALERINPEGESNSESNWSSSTHVSGGTPNAENTIFQEPGAPPESVGINFSPNPFSPDDDGFEDNLFINYTLDAPDYLLRVRIFDRYGREVRELADGVQAGFEGSLTWDGLTDDRKKNRVGIYIVLFEAYNSANGSDRTFKETVVLARMF